MKNSMWNNKDSFDESMLLNEGESMNFFNLADIKQAAAVSRHTIGAFTTKNGPSGPNSAVHRITSIR